MKRSRRNNQNMLELLRRRETLAPLRPSGAYALVRRFYLAVLPSHTVSPVDMPPCFLRKFSPDGRYLIAFASHQAALEIFEYRGISSVGNLLARQTGLDTADDDLLRRDIFHTLFRRTHTVPVAAGHQALNRECSLFTTDSRFVIIASSIPSQEERSPHMFQIYRNNECLPRIQALEDYCIYSIRLSDGHLIDKQWFKCDKIYLSHNQGMYLHDRTLAILSVQHQTIYVYYIEPHGTFMHVRDIGRFLDSTDELLWNASLVPTYLLNAHGPRNQPLQPMAETHLLNSLKQRFLAALFRKAASAWNQHSDSFPLRNFYRHWDYFRWLRIWKIQLLDDDVLLLRYASEEVVQRKVEPDSQNSYFVFYDMTTTEVLGVFENVSTDLLSLYEAFADHFRNLDPSITRFPCSLASSFHARRTHDRLKETIINAKNGGRIEATRRLLNVLPISAQSFSASAYLDPELFSYDEKWISVMERPKAYSGDYPIKFFGRDSGLLKFSFACNLIDSGPVDPRGGSPTKHLVAFIFHPSDPLVISIQRHPVREYVVNFHLRSPLSWLAE